MTKSILVIGATGKQGYAVVQQLLNEGWNVRALTRNANNEKLAALHHTNLEIFQGDLNNKDVLVQAMTDQYGVYSVQPIIKDNVEEELRQGTLIIETAEQQNINYVVYSTAGGVNRNRTGSHFEALAEIENTLAASTLNYTIIKPTFIMDNFLRIATVEEGRIYIPEFIAPDIKFAMISTNDIAKIVANIFKTIPKFNQKSIEIASDELSLNEVIEIFSSATSKLAIIQGSFTSETVDRSWLEEKGYEVDFDQMDQLNPERLHLNDWIRNQQF